MAFPEPPLWCRITLTIFTIGSFVPQILRIQRKQSIYGISSLSVLWNLISATEQLTIYFYGLVTENDPNAKTIFLHFPITAGDWFSLCHCAVVTISFLVMFAQVLLYSDRSARLCASYVAFLLISIIPLLIDSVSPMDYEARRLWSAIYFALHSMLLWPIITFLGCLSVYRQAREILTVPFPNSLSLQGLAMQAVVFTLVSVVWIWCLPFPYEDLPGHMSWNTFTIWYGTIGWVIVDSFVFAIGPVMLLVLALRRPSLNKLTIQRGGETEPLLG